MKLRSFFLFAFLGTSFQSFSCGFALLQMRKPLSYYAHAYNDATWGIHTITLLLEKQRNRGQDGVGCSIMQYDMPAGEPFMKRYRAIGKKALENLCLQINKQLAQTTIPENGTDRAIKQSSRLVGELYLGHLRYGTYGGDDIKFAQPHHYKNNVRAKCVMFTGNFNMTNNTDIFNAVISYGINPSSSADTHIITHQISYWLDKMYEESLAKAYKKESSTTQAARNAADTLDIVSAVKQASELWDGGYVFAVGVGTGDAFICRDPAGIRPGFYYENEDFFAAASERSALMNSFNLEPDQVQEIPPGHILLIKKNGTSEFHRFADPVALKQCSFERIYFSRPNDPAIYQERKDLGKNLAHRLFKELSYDLSHAVFSYIPNSSEISFHGLIEELNQCNLQHSYQEHIKSGKPISALSLAQMLHKTHVAKLIFKDQTIRTFIANDAIRSTLVKNVYDVTRGVVSDQDTLIALDDSIVRGTTLRESIIKQLVTLNPKKIIISSAAPLILYPGCYGIDMSQIGRLIGFQAAIALTKERGNQALIDNLFLECTRLKETNSISFYNPIKKLYAQFTQEELEAKVAELVYPNESGWNKELKVMYQTIEGMHNALPAHQGDWYFTGDYPTIGGYRVVINSFINWYTAKTIRAY